MSSGADKSDAAKPLIAILPRRVVVIIAVAAFLLAICLIVWALVRPIDFATSFARFILCLAISFSLGVFLFVSYPSDYRLTKVPLVDLPIEVVGPAALFLILLSVLLKLMPVPEGGRLHLFVDRSGQEINAADIGTVILSFEGGEAPRYYLIPGENCQSLRGIYVYYAEAVRSLKASIKAAKAFKSEEIELQRDNPDPIHLALERD